MTISMVTLKQHSIMVKGMSFGVQPIWIWILELCHLDVVFRALNDFRESNFCGVIRAESML